MKIKLTKQQWMDAGARAGWVKTAQHLGNVKALERLTERELARAIRDAIIAEEDAIKQYETVVDSTDNESAKEVLQEIANEEKVHVGELQKLLSSMLKDEQGFLDEGAEEASGKTEERVDESKANKEDVA